MMNVAHRWFSILVTAGIVERDWVGWYRVHRTGLKLCPTRPVFAAHDMAKFNVWRILVAESLWRESL